MLFDELNEFADASSVANAAGTYVLGDVIDLGNTTNYLGTGGEPVYAVIECTTQMITGGTASATERVLPVLTVPPSERVKTESSAGASAAGRSATRSVFWPGAAGVCADAALANPATSAALSPNNCNEFLAIPSLLFSPLSGACNAR